MQAFFDKIVNKDKKLLPAPFPHVNSLLLVALNAVRGGVKRIELCSALRFNLIIITCFFYFSTSNYDDTFFIFVY